MIIIDTSLGLCEMHSTSSSYLIGVTEQKLLCNLHFGPDIGGPFFENSRQIIPGPRSGSMSEPRPLEITPDPNDKKYVPAAWAQEYGVFGGGDYRNPALEIITSAGYHIPDFKVRSMRKLDSKPPLPGLPAALESKNTSQGLTRPSQVDKESETLAVSLWDDLTQVEVILFYTVYGQHDVYTRSARIINHGNSHQADDVIIKRAMSLCLDLPAFPPAADGGTGWDIITLPGAWARERHVSRHPVPRGKFCYGSTKGVSSHDFNPFCALVAAACTESHGSAYGFNLIYSGNFSGEVEMDGDGKIRYVLGINPQTFSWRLKPGEAFDTPEAVLVYSGEGLRGLSRRFHTFIRNYILRGNPVHRPRPVLINSWEAAYFDFDARKLLSFSKNAAELGVELFVLDDGWFGNRNDDTTSLGDWYTNCRKLPEGLLVLADSIKQQGQSFGIWIEPEMVSVDSDFYREHPDWCLHIPGRARGEGRNQLVLDLSRFEVKQEIIQAMSNIFTSAPIVYVKWDMNRYLSHTGSPNLGAEKQGELYHRYILGLYDIITQLQNRFPDILFEGCAAGGGRFDLGMLTYMPQYWTSDNTDAVSRLKIQFGTSLAYPPVCMGSHVSSVPNHQTGRFIPAEFRSLVALGGNYGFELDPALLSPEEHKLLAADVAWYKKNRDLIHTGDFYRLESPFIFSSQHRLGSDQGLWNLSSAGTIAPFVSWMFVAQNKNEAALFRFATFIEPNQGQSRLSLYGLDPEKTYNIQIHDRGADSAKHMRTYQGKLLYHHGLTMPAPKHDFHCFLIELSAV